MRGRPSTAWVRIRALFRGASLDRDMDREIQAHLDLLTAEYEASGMAPREARSAALRRFGNTGHIKERGRDVRGPGLAGDVLRDARYALRLFRRAPGFTAAVVLILAIGIGANAAIFSMMNALILGELPYPDGEQLVAVYETEPRYGEYMPATPENWVDWLERSRSFSALAAWGFSPATLTGEGEALTVTGQQVSAEFLPLLGVEPLLGRVFTPEEDRPNAPRVVILSHALWQNRYGGDPNVLGRTIELSPAFGGQPGGNQYEVVGVMPEGFSFVPANGPAQVDYWMPFALNRVGASDGHFIFVLGRLRPGVTPAAAQMEMTSLSAQLAAERGDSGTWRVNVAPLQADRVRDLRTSLLLLFAAVGALILLACFNVAGLILARGVHRRQEMAIRVSLGAGRAAIARQLLTEGVVLAVAGACLGLVVFRWTVDGLIALAPIGLLETLDLGLDRRVLLYTLGLSMVTAIVFTLAPVLTSGRESFGMHAVAGGRTVTRTMRVRQGLAIAQVALALMLVAGAGLLGRTLQELLGGDNGLDVEHVLSLPVSLPLTGYDRHAQIAFFREAVERLGDLPGVRSAAAGRTLPITGVVFTRAFHVEGTPEIPPPGQTAATDLATVRVREVTAGYFRTLGVPILRGRGLSTDDLREGAPPVFVVNESLARRYFPAGDPLGAPLSLGSQLNLSGTSLLHGRIVGVAGDVKEGSLRTDAEPVVFVDHGHVTHASMTLFVRADRIQGVPQAAVEVIRRMDPDLPVTPAWLEDAFADSVARDRMNAVVLGAFAVTALVLAAFGIYGMLVYIVADRTKEIGIRIALGAPPGRVLRYVVGLGARIVIPGVALGLAGALAFSRSLESVLYGVTPYDPATLALVVAVLLAVAVVAVWVPARRAARVDPLLALQEE